MSGCTWTSFVTLGKPGNNPFCHHRAIEMPARASASASCASRPRREPFDHGTFEIVEEAWPADELERARDLR